MSTSTAEPATQGTSHHTAEPAASRLDEEFFALVYSDEELVRDEFEDLMAAVWPGQPPASPTPGEVARQPDLPTSHRPVALGPKVRGVTVVPGARARNRSPPKPTGNRRRR